MALSLWVACASEPPAPTPAAAPPAADTPQVVARRSDQSFDVVLLGTGTPVPDPERSGPATAVVVGGRTLLFDAGPGVVRQAQQAASRHQLPELAPDAIRHLFLTHLHSDHTTGLPDLLLGGWVLGRPGSLRVVGPPGTQELVDKVLQGWSADIAIRKGPGEDLDPAGLRVEVVELEEGVAYVDEGVKVRALPVPHGTWDTALAYVVDSGDERVVISGDTAPSEALMAACDGCEVLVHEVYSKLGYDAVPSASFHAYHGSFHTSGVQLGKLATVARPEHLVLTHLLLFGASEAQLQAEVREGFDGEVTVGEDLARFVVRP